MSLSCVATVASVATRSLLVDVILSELSFIDVSCAVSFASMRTTSCSRVSMSPSEAVALCLSVAMSSALVWICAICALVGRGSFTYPVPSGKYTFPASSPILFTLAVALL